ncbi:MAG: squalene--hopene cyclase, partial [Anaerolineaceae bacterium]|nr:squalene--hopene cyclase [Anaerolineaceae bacterium]
SVRDDGCWPIDSNLSVWLTTLSINALGCGPAGRAVDLRAAIRWVIDRQHREVHPFTGVAPGGWAWTHLDGGVPDADDTSGALLAIAAADDPRAADSWRRGLAWLMNLQNDDGGWPTFCRGWGKLPFDRSGADLTAHAIRAISCRPPRCEPPGRTAGVSDSRAGRAVARGLLFLSDSQREDGSWLSLWFGNQRVPGGENPVFGTARVMAAYRDLGRTLDAPARSGLGFLLSAQNADGGWGGGGGGDGQGGPVGSVEETAVVVEALVGWVGEARVRRSVLRGLGWLTERIRDGGLDRPSPIGLYFTRLWYSERVYPIIFGVAAMGRALSSEAAIFRGG